MAPPASSFLAFLTLSLISNVYSAPSGSFNRATILERAAAVRAEYDYVIVGGGTAGLTVGDRLTEDGKYTVLVIENGVLDNSSAILTGGGGGGMDPSRMYNINSAPQTELNNRVFSVGLGKCVGGSSAVNGMVFHRGTAEEYDIWGELGGGNSTWNWKGILPYFRKGIHFTPPDATFASQMNVSYDPNAWGQEPNTRIYATFSTMASGVTKFMYNAYRAFPGIDVPKDGGAGTNGLLWFTTSMDPTATTRSYARTGHWDNIRRSNYELVTGQKVNKILFSGDTATGVQFIPSNGGQVTTVKANKEVILAAGAVHTPQILQLSGIGPSALLRQANIPVLVDLPGVGANFQDHAYLPTVNYQWGRQPQFPTVNVPMRGLANPNLGVFLGLPVISPDYEKIAVKYETQDPATYLPRGIDATVVAGYKAQQKAFARAMRSKGVSFLELMVMGPGGSPQNMHPVSRGTIYINPQNPQSEPSVDYRALSNPVDTDVMVEMIKFLRRFMTTGTLAQYQARETTPGPNVNTDAQIISWLRGQINPSVFHPIGTCAKMPRELGGVVSEDLLVWGTKKLSVVDASILPTLVGGTISMTVYAVAEKAADIIKARA